MEVTFIIQHAGDQTDRVFAGLLIFAVAGMLLTVLVHALEHRFEA